MGLATRRHGASLYARLSVAGAAATGHRRSANIDVLRATAAAHGAGRPRVLPRRGSRRQAEPQHGPCHRHVLERCLALLRHQRLPDRGAVPAIPSGGPAAAGLGPLRHQARRADPARLLAGADRGARARHRLEAHALVAAPAARLPRPGLRAGRAQPLPVRRMDAVGRGDVLRLRPACRVAHLARRAPPRCRHRRAGEGRRRHLDPVDRMAYRGQFRRNARAPDPGQRAGDARGAALGAARIPLCVRAGHAHLPCRIAAGRRTRRPLGTTTAA